MYHMGYFCILCVYFMYIYTHTHTYLDMYGDIYYVSIHIIFYSVFLYFSNLPVCVHIFSEVLLFC